MRISLIVSASLSEVADCSRTPERASEVASGRSSERLALTGELAAFVAGFVRAPVCSYGRSEDWPVLIKSCSGFSKLDFTSVAGCSVDASRSKGSMAA